MLIVNIKIVPMEQDMILFPNKIMEQLKIQQNQSISLLFGLTDKIMIKVKSRKTNHNELLISSSIKDKINLPFSKSLLIKKEANGIRLGPVIGILTTDLTGSKFNTIHNRKLKSHFGDFFKGLLIHGQSLPVYYFAFTPDRINWKTMKVQGLFYQPKLFGDTWKEFTMPLPEVIYNRVPNRQAEKNHTVERLKMEHERLGGKLFNYDFFNKWDIYKLVESEENIKQYIPETYLNPTLTTLKQMTDKHPIVYLKPASGSLGLGIYKVRKLANGYNLQYRSGNHNKSDTFSGLLPVFSSIFSNKKTSNYLIQQGVNLTKFKERPVDFRIQLHKNKDNQWNLVAIGGKAAGLGSVTTHVRTGGTLIDANKFLRLMYGDKTSTILNNIKTASIQIAKAVEEKSGKPLGELGLDIGIDENQKIWLFEVNSKPGRSIFKHPSIKKAGDLASRYLLEYAIYLAKQ